MLDPVSPQAQSVTDLFNISLLIAAVILALVTGLVVYISFRFRRRSDNDQPAQRQGNLPLEIAWTLVPAAIVVGLFTLTVTGIGKAEPSETPAVRVDDVAAGKQTLRASEVVLVAHQWWWEIRYPSANVVTANEIHLPVGKKVLFQLQAADVVHGVWIPQLGPQLQPIPGHISFLYLQGDRPGTYLGACSEFCGTAHEWMLLKALVQPQAEYDAWLRGQSLPATPIATPAATPSPALTTGGLPLSAGDPARGAQTFRQRTCISCHAINGTDANGQAGPNLTHFASRSILGAGVLANNPANLAQWLANPQKVKPGNYMPNMLLSAQEVRDLVSYMETLK